MHLVNMKNEPVTLGPGDKVSVFYDGRVYIQKHEGETINFGSNSNVCLRILWDGSTNPEQIMQLICCMLGLSYRLLWACGGGDGNVYELLKS